MKKKSTRTRSRPSPEGSATQSHHAHMRRAKRGAAAARPDVPYVVRRSKIHGRGVYATRHIAKGARVVEYLGDRITHWATHNEPWVVAWIGHAWGEHAPGRTSEAGAISSRSASSRLRARDRCPCSPSAAASRS